MAKKANSPPFCTIKKLLLIKTAFLYNYFFVDRGMFFVVITQIIS